MTNPTVEELEPQLKAAQDAFNVQSSEVVRLHYAVLAALVRKAVPEATAIEVRAGNNDEGQPRIQITDVFVGDDKQTANLPDRQMDDLADATFESLLWIAELDGIDHLGDEDTLELDDLAKAAEGPVYLAINNTDVSGTAFVVRFDSQAAYDAWYMALDALTDNDEEPFGFRGEWGIAPAVITPDQLMSMVVRKEQ